MQWICGVLYSITHRTPVRNSLPLQLIGREDSFKNNFKSILYLQSIYLWFGAIGAERWVLSFQKMTFNLVPLILQKHFSHLESTARYYVSSNGAIHQDMVAKWKSMQLFFYAQVKHPCSMHPFLLCSNITVQHQDDLSHAHLCISLLPFKKRRFFFVLARSISHFLSASVSVYFAKQYIAQFKKKVAQKEKKNFQFSPSLWINRSDNMQFLGISYYSSWSDSFKMSMQYIPCDIKQRNKHLPLCSVKFLPCFIWTKTCITKCRILGNNSKLLAEDRHMIPFFP